MHYMTNLVPRATRFIQRKATDIHLAVLRAVVRRQYRIADALETERSDAQWRAYALRDRSNAAKQQALSVDDAVIAETERLGREAE